MATSKEVKDKAVLITALNALSVAPYDAVIFLIMESTKIRNCFPVFSDA